jgi:hypothetical protein
VLPGSHDEKADAREYEKIAFQHRYSKSLQEHSRWRILQESAPENTDIEKLPADMSLLFFAKKQE